MTILRLKGARRLLPAAIASLLLMPVSAIGDSQAPVMQLAQATSYPVQTLIDDMANPNDEALKNHRQFGWAIKHLPGFNVLGPNNSQRPYLLPWYTLAEGSSNRNHNVSLQTRNMQVWVLSNNQWRRTHGHSGHSGSYFPQWSNYFNNAQGRYWGDSVPIRYGQNLHGWWGGRIGTGSVQAVVVAVQARLTGGDAWRARYLMNVGADWYPNQSGASKVVLRSVGISRAKWVTGDWQWVTMTTLSNVGIQEPGGGISTSQLWRNPPPLQ